MWNLCITKPEIFVKGSPDKNGLMPVILLPLAGKIPAKMVIAGTIAKNAGFQTGRIYLAQWVAGEMDEQYGRAYTFKLLSEINDPLQLMELLQRLGPVEILREKEEVKVTETKSDFDL